MNRYEEIRQKRNILRELYGGTMTCSDIQRELGGTWESARRFGEENRLCIRIGKRTRYDTDGFARAFVILRENSNLEGSP